MSIFLIYAGPVECREACVGNITATQFNNSLYLSWGNDSAVCPKDTMLTVEIKPDLRDAVLLIKNINVTSFNGTSFNVTRFATGEYVIKVKVSSTSFCSEVEAEFAEYFRGG